MKIIENLRASTDEFITRLKDLQIGGHSDRDLGAVARDAAATWESNLKAACGGSSSQGLNDLALSLGADGWSASDSLHVIRRAANREKHEPNALHSAEAILLALQGVYEATGRLEQMRPGVMNQLPERLRRRRMVCAIYDFFAHGETCYGIFAADPDAKWCTVERIDSFEVRNKDSASIERRLSELDGWVVDPVEFAALRESLQESDSELWQIAVFTASYQEVVDIIGTHQHDLDLLPGLHREDDRLALVASCASAFVNGQHYEGAGRANAGINEIRVAVESFLHLPFSAFGLLQVDRCSYERFLEMAKRAYAVDYDIPILVSSSGVIFVPA